MCLLTFFPAGVLPDCEALRNGAYANDDGHGYAIVDSDRIIVGRGMDAEAMIESFALLRAASPDGPALFHSRYSTHGVIDVDNVHPFAVGGDERTIIAHNGVLPSSVQPVKGDARSDTRIAAEDFLPRFGSLRTRRARARFENWMTPYNKIVILTVDRRFKDRAYILNERAGTWDGGIWYSNSGYQPVAGGGSSLAFSRFEYEYACPECSSLLDAFDQDCAECGWCADCCEMPEFCQCYLPAEIGARR
jgi:hypothetical protein